MDELCKGCPTLFYLYMMNCKSLDFADEPEYDYLISLIEDYAFSLKIDLYDNVYDWSVKSTTILNFANFV